MVVSLLKNQQAKKKDWCIYGSTQDVEDLCINFTHVNYDTNGEHYLTAYGLCNLHQRSLDLTNQHSTVGRRGITNLSRGLTQNYVVNFVELKSCELGVIGAQCVGHVLKHNNTLTYLGLAANKFDSEAAQYLGAGLSANSRLRKLDLSNNDLRHTGVGYIGEGLTKNHTLRILNLSNNKITPQFSSNFCVDLSANTALVDLNLAYNKISDNGVKGLAQSLRMHKALQKVTLTKNAISQAGGHYLFNALQTACKLVALDLTSNRVSGAVRNLIAVLPTATRLKQLNLSGNFISPDDALVLADGLSRNHSLLDINVAYNDIKNKGALAVLKALFNSQTLTKLCLTKCEIDFQDDQLCDALCSVVRTCPQLRILEISGNSVGVDTANKFAQTIQQCDAIGLQSLNLAETKIEAIGAAVILSTVTDIQNFCELNVAGNNIGDAGLLKIAAAIKSQGGLGSLVLLDLSDNHLSIGVEMTLSELLLGSERLKKIVLCDNKVSDGLPNGVMHPMDALKLLETYQRCNKEMLTLCMSQQHKYLLDLSGKTPTEKPEGKQFDDLSLDLIKIRKDFLEEEKHKQELESKEWESLGNKPPDPRIPTLSNNIGGLLITDAQLRRKFDQLDTEGKGVLSREEFRAMFTKIEGYGVEWNDESIERLMHRNHINSGDTLSFDEFSIIMLQVVQW